MLHFNKINFRKVMMARESSTMFRNIHQYLLV